MEFGDVEAGGWVLESRSPPPPAVTVLEAAVVHCSELRIWVTADLEVGPGSPARSLVFLKCYGTLPLCTTSGHKLNPRRHFLELVQQKLKERGFGVNPEIPRVYSPVPCSKLVAPWRPVLIMLKRKMRNVATEHWTSFSVHFRKHLLPTFWTMKDVF